MPLHEKSLELSITHELLNLADSWYWFLTDIPLWRYWRPRYRLPFLKYPTSFPYALHTNLEGVNDPTGVTGGGYDVRITTGVGRHLLFIQYKKPEYAANSPGPGTEFDTPPHEHYKFNFGSVGSNQHFLLRNLAAGIGGQNGNAVVYAFPLIADLNEFEQHAGKIVRRTKFISIQDIDNLATAIGYPILPNAVHNFRVDKIDMNRCELNFFFHFYNGPDRSKELIADVIAVRFQETLAYYLKELSLNYKKYTLSMEYLSEGLIRAFGQYSRYLLHYFEVNPVRAQTESMRFLFRNFLHDYDLDEFEGYKSDPRDVEIINAVFNKLKRYASFLSDAVVTFENNEAKLNVDVPPYYPDFLATNSENGLVIRLNNEFRDASFDNISCLII